MEHRHHLRAVAARFVYLVAILDWFSRYVLAWELSVTVDGQFCLDALEMALGQRTPEIFNTDQGSQFTADPVYGSDQGGRGTDQHGRSGPRAGQCLRRTAVAGR